MNASDPLCGVCGHVKSLHVDGRCRGYHDNSYDPYDADDDPCHCTEHMSLADAQRKDMTLQEQVIEFHRAFGHPVLDKPSTDISDERVRLRARLIAEEALETLAAMFDSNVFAWAKTRMMATIDSAVVQVDLGKLADGLADLDYVSEGTRLEFGIEGRGVAHRVHCANMAKLWTCGECGGAGRVQSSPNIGHHCPPCKGTGKVPVRDAYGKTVKPEGWQPPDIDAEIKRQQDDSHRFGLLKKTGGRS